MTEGTSRTLRLVCPQWQGGIITRLVPDLAPEEAATAYALGASLLDFLAPETNDADRAVVPVTLDASSRTARHGIMDFDAIERQTKAALEILDARNPDRVVTLGGDCSASVAPFLWLAEQYGPEDTAILWLDAHPDLNRPGDAYEGWHAMALAACIGRCGDVVSKMLPAPVPAGNALICGLRVWDPDGGTKARQAAFGVRHLAPETVEDDPAPVIEWLRRTGAKHVLVHLDLDVLDPDDLFVAVGNEPGGLTGRAVVRIIRAVADEFDLVGLTVAEPMPRRAVRLRSMLADLPLF